MIKISKLLILFILATSNYNYGSNNSFSKLNSSLTNKNNENKYKPLLNTKYYPLNKNTIWGIYIGNHTFWMSHDLEGLGPMLNTGISHGFFLQSKLIKPIYLKFNFEITNKFPLSNKMRYKDISISSYYIYTSVYDYIKDKENYMEDWWRIFNNYFSLQYQIRKHWSIESGMFYMFAINHDNHFSETDWEDIYGNVLPFENWGLISGLNYRFGKRFEFGLRYFHGLYKDIYTIYRPNEQQEKAFSYRHLCIQLNYLFNSFNSQ